MPMLVAVYGSLPNDNFALLCHRLSNDHVDRRRFIKEVFIRETRIFEGVPASSLCFHNIMKIF